MAFDDILQKIQADGSQAAAAVQAEGAAAATRIRERGEREAEESRAALRRRAERRAKEHRDRLVTLAQLEHRKAVLAEKQRSIGDAFAEAEARLRDLPREDAWNLLHRVIVAGAETGREEVVVGHAQAGLIDDAFLARVNRTLGDRGHLTLAAEPGDFSHGVVLREGRKDINLRLAVLMAEAREQFVHHIAQQLFPPEAAADG